MPKHTAAGNHPSSGSATAHQKLHALYQSVLHTSPVLALLAAEITWPKVMELMTAKHYPMGHTVWRAGQVPTEVGFVLEGQFDLQSASDNNACASATSTACPRGASVAGYATLHHVPLEYSVVAVKYKSTLMTVSKSKFTTILRQLDASRAQQLQDLFYSTHQDDMRALYPPAVAAPLTNPRLPPAPVAPPPPSHPTTLAVEYESSCGTLVLHEPVRTRRGSLKPRLHPICVKAKANMARRLEQLHIPEHYQSGHATSSLKHTSHHGTVTKSKPMGRLLKSLDKHNDPLVVHAERELACGTAASLPLSVATLLKPPAALQTQSTPALQPSTSPHLLPTIHLHLPPVKNVHVRMDPASLQPHTTLLGSTATPMLPSHMNPLQRPTTVPNPPPPLQ